VGDVPMAKLGIAVLSGLILTLAVPSRAQHQVANFSIGGSEFTMPVPEGYCTSDGPLAEVANAEAEMDTLNFTLATLFGCKGGEIQIPLERYIVIKTPRLAVHDSLDKAATLESLEADARGPNAESDAEIEQGIEDSYQRVRGIELELDTRTRLLGRDEECVYIGGTIESASNGTSASARAVACLTIRGQKAIFVNVYDLRSDEHVVGMRSTARSVADSMAAVP
jgi:hypothetical protein